MSSECLQCVFRVSLECLQSVFRVCSECLQSVLNIEVISSSSASSVSIFGIFLVKIYWGLSLRTFWEEQLADQFRYFNFSLYLVIFRADQLKKPPCIFCHHTCWIKGRADRRRVHRIYSWKVNVKCRYQCKKYTYNTSFFSCWYYDVLKWQTKLDCTVCESTEVCYVAPNS